MSKCKSKIKSKKSNIVLLDEICTRKKIARPTFEFAQLKNHSFDCTAIVAGITVIGNGRSKRNAKMDAAIKLLPQLRDDANSDPTPDAESDCKSLPPAEPNPFEEFEQDFPPVDMVNALRSYCLQRGGPMPEFNVVSWAGPTNEPCYTGICTLRNTTIRRQAFGINKKEARQNAAGATLLAVHKEKDMHKIVDQIISKGISERDHPDNYFRTFGKLVESGSRSYTGITVADRHNYFTNFKDPMKTTARAVVNAKYESEKEQAMDIFKALQLIPIISSVDESVLMITVDCELDVIFVQVEDKIYREIIDYFDIMLN